LTIYWFKDGKIQSEANYKNDLLHGTSKWYHENGKKKKSAVYMNGLFVGSTVWDENGNILENNLPISD
jgi:antitoxin component YwqK of YwqJK toxin-antitoxin module